ncbi:MAG: hypothetical protein AB7C95_00870 [Synergistaceae bacterium]
MPDREDIYIRHQIELASLTKGEIASVQGRFLDLEKSIAKELYGSGRLTDWRRDRLEAQLQMLRAMINSFYTSLQTENLASMNSLSDLEVRWNADVLTAMAGADAVAITGTAVVQAVTARPFQGAVFSEWWEGLDNNLQTAVSRSIRNAWATGQSIPDVEKVLGPVLARAKQNTTAVIRSGIMDLASTARTETFRANADIVKAEVWLSTLDGHTSLICRLRDGKAYTLDGKPIGHKLPYAGGPGKAHWGCRSTGEPVLKGENVEDRVNALDRPSVDYNKKTKSRAHSTLRYDPESGKVVGKGVRNPDAERRGAAVETRSRYEAWFRRQPAWVQDRVLGKRKGALYRKNGMELVTFSEDGLRPLTISELQEKGYQL